jgi:hypothetical protein
LTAVVEVFLLPLAGGMNSDEQDPQHGHHLLAKKDTKITLKRQFAFSNEILRRHTFIYMYMCKVKEILPTIEPHIVVIRINFHTFRAIVLQ